MLFRSLPKLSEEEIKRLEKWIDECPDTKRFEGQVYISIAAFKYMLRWNDKDLTTNLFLDVLSAANTKYGAFPIRQFLVADMGPELILKLKQSGVTI